MEDPYEQWTPRGVRDSVMAWFPDFDLWTFVDYLAALLVVTQMTRVIVNLCI